MKENGIAKIFRVVAIISIVCSVIGSIGLGLTYASLVGNTGWILAITLFFAGVISFLMYLWYAEVVSLLQKSVNVQEEILDQIKKQN